MATYNWTDWAPFPDPRLGGMLAAPFGPGVYELRRRSTEELVRVGKGRCCAYRMSSLLPDPFGQGTRNNSALRSYVLAHLSDLDYRTLPCDSDQEAGAAEGQHRARFTYRFPG